VATVDLGVIRTHLEAELESDPDFVLDARADAYGHGLREVIDLAIGLGVGTVRVSPSEADRAGVRRSRLMTVDPASRRLLRAEAYGIGADYSAMTLTSEVVASKPTEPGAGVSYSYTYRTERPTTLALVALGYADGVPRLASNRAQVWIAGRLVPLVGRVAMDQFVADCADAVPELGADVVVWGSRSAGHPTAIDWAEWTNRDPLDLTAGIGPRVERAWR
jgi:alanine racemase